MAPSLFSRRSSRRRAPARRVAAAWVIAALVASRAALAQRDAGGGAAASDAPLEVTVHGNKASSNPIGGDEFRARDIRAVPGTFGDPFQALAALPGVAPMASGLPFFYVRGAPPADTGYFVDGVPIPTLFHIGPGASVVPQALVDRVDFYPGAAPARYGRYVGGIIAGQTTAPTFATHGEANVRLFDASAFLETPVGESNDVVVAGRYGYPNLLLSIFAPSLSLHFWDYTVRLTHKFTPTNSVSLFAIGADDREEDSSQNLVPIDSQFHRVDLRYDHRWGTGSLRVATTFGYDRTSGNIPASAAETVNSKTGRWRVELVQHFGRSADVSAGADLNTTHYGFALNQVSDTPAPVGDEEVAGAYADFTWRVLPGVELKSGVRVDEYHPSAGLPGKDAFGIDPKLSARVRLTRAVTWVSTLGLAHQEPSYVVPIPGVRVFTQSGLQKVYSLSGGAELRLPWDVKARVIGFFEADRDVTDFVAACGASYACSSVASVDGRTYGVEVLVERALTHDLGGWLSYTLSRAERDVANVSYLSPFDRTQVLSAVLHYDFGHGYGGGVRGTYYSGRPDIPTFVLSANSPSYAFAPGKIPQHRLPDFYRLDVRLDKRWSLGQAKWITLAAEFFDATLSKEAVDFKCNLTTTPTLCTAQHVGPIALPSIGLEGGF